MTNTIFVNSIKSFTLQTKLFLWSLVAPDWHNLLTTKGKTEIQRQVSSTKCFQELQTGGLIKSNYKCWKPKITGVMKGIILFGETKTGLPKKIYIKNYSENYKEKPLFVPKITFNPLNDFAAFTILKKCGAAAPKVKLKSTKTSTYIFSTDIAQKKKINSHKNYSYFNLFDCPYKVENEHLNQLNGAIPESINKSIFLDKKSFIRLILLARILNLRDLHNENIGFLISENKDRTKAKLACIDFSIGPWSPISENNYYSVQSIVEECLDHRFVDLDDRTAIKRSLTKEDYIDAFKNIEEYFMTACNEVKNKVKQMTTADDISKANTYELIDQWQENFRVVQEMIDQQKKLALIIPQRDI